MPSPRDFPIADAAPTDPQITDYDRAHLAIYLRLLDAESDAAAWEEVARIVLNIDPEHEPERARRAYTAHLARAHWLGERGYRNLLRSWR